MVEPDSDMFHAMDELSNALKAYDNASSAAEVQSSIAPAADLEFDNTSLPSDMDTSWYDYPVGRCDHPVENLEFGDYYYRERGATTLETDTHRRVTELFHPPSRAYDNMMQVKARLFARNGFLFQKNQIMTRIIIVLDSTWSETSDKPMAHHTQGSDPKPIDQDLADTISKLHCVMSVFRSTLSFLASLTRTSLRTTYETTMKLSRRYLRPGDPTLV